ncbi:MAG: CXXX repeat peptide maturase, partial [Thermoguttaceae bacterium]
VIRLKLRKGLQSLFVLMDSAAPSFCYYKTREMERKVMDDETLKKVAYYALTENLSLNLILGEGGLTDTQKEILKWNDYVVYRSGKAKFPADDKTINVFDFEADTWDDAISPMEMLVLRISKDHIAELPAWLEAHSLTADRITVFVKEMETMKEAEFEPYKAILDQLKAWLPEREEEKPFELSLLTDRLQLEKPNHCDAGVKHVTIGPDGNFYVCPGFYYREKNKDFLIANIDTVLTTHELPIKNPQLYKLDHAPICENCDAWQCRRCVWLNKETTLEVNTPSRQQCVCAHLERNASRDLLEPLFLTDMVQIPKIDYLDPFDELMKKNKPFIEKGKVDEC